MILFKSETRLRCDRNTVKKIANRRKVSVQAVYKIINTIKKKGMWNKLFLRHQNNETYTQPPTNKRQKPIRLHGQHFLIKIIPSDLPKYRKMYTPGQKMFINGNTIEFNDRNIEVYFNTDFFGTDPNDCAEQSQLYYLRFFYMLEIIL